MPRRAESVIDEAHRIEAERLEEEADDERHHEQPQEDGCRRAAGEPGDEVVGHGLFLKSELTRRLHDFAPRHPAFRVASGGSGLMISETARPSASTAPRDRKSV